MSRNAAMKAWQQTADERREDIPEDGLGFNHTLILVDKQKGSADRKADKQDNCKRQVS
jgi:hypothetical protein